MSATVKPLGLYDLLAPQFLAGFQFPDFIDKYLSLLAVAEFQSTSDPNATLYTGTVFFPSAPGNPPVLQHRDPSGAVLDIHDLTLRFRLLVSRNGSAKVKTVIDTIASVDTTFQPVQQIVDSFGAQTATPTDYPGIAFQLELLVSTLSFHLGDSWKPAKLGGAAFISIDPDAVDTDVRIELPKVLLRYSQSQDFTEGTDFQLASFGNPGFDAPNDFSEGELATMVPPLAIHKSGDWAIGIDEIVVDLSENNTPPEILEHFGTDEGFKGFFVKSLQLYYGSKDKDLQLNFAIRDALISLDGKVWLETEIDLLLDTPFKVTVRIYDGDKLISFNEGTDPDSKNEFTGGTATIPATAVIYLQVEGGVPPFSYSVEFTPSGGSAQQMWSDPNRQARLNPAPTTSQSGPLVIQVSDSAETPHKYKNTLALNVAVAGTPPPTPPDLKPAIAEWHPDPLPPGLPADIQIQFTAAPAGTTTESLTILGGATLPTVTANGQPKPIGADRRVIVEVPAGATIPVEVDFAGTSFPGTFNLLFTYDEPSSVAAESNYVSANGQPPDPTPADQTFLSNRPPSGTPNANGHIGADALRHWVKNALDLAQPITIVGKASNEGTNSDAQHNKTLSQRRADIANTIVTAAGGSVSSAVGVGQTGNTSSLQSDRVAVITGTPISSSAFKLTGSLFRPAAKTPPAPETPKKPPEAPAAPANQKPRFIRRLSLRVRLEHDLPVLVEFSGEVDFETDTEKALREATGNTPGSLELQNKPAASKNPNPSDGVVDFSLLVTYDLATGNATETLKIGAAPADVDGLVAMTNAAPFSRLKDTLGAVLVFTPIISAVTEAIAPATAGDWIAIGVDLGVPAAIGALGFVHTTNVTLFGGEMVLRENIPAGDDPATFTNASITFDYSVSFRFDVNALGIHSTRDMKVRYKAVGLNLHFGDPVKLEFVLDTSKGYSLELSDPGLFDLPGPLAKILKIAAARIGRFNPLTIELDIEMKADLGIITVDKFQVKIPLDGSSSPMILPSGIKVNIPSAVVGSGSVKIANGGFEGTLDITIVPIKLRVAASVGVEHISQPPREATAFFLGLEVDFPAPVVIGSTGLGLFGLFGLFAMHYNRVLDAPVAGDAVGPDLRWLIKTGGAPYKLSNNGNQLWTPQIDNWAFGVGAVLGTVDGFLLNMRGMFLLELPGPRIIITVNLAIIQDLPGVSPNGMDAAHLDVGIIGILDIDLGLGQITLGVMIALEVKSLIKIEIPIQVFFDMNIGSNWHVWIGTIQTPASADILGIARGTGYFMAGGQAIAPFPPGTTGTLPGVAVATGISASIVWGSEDVGIYLKVTASADLGVSFTPHLFVIGNVHLEGKLRLIIVSVGAHGDFTVTAPDPFSLHVHVCGSVSFFFFDISACVDFNVGGTPPPPPPAPLIAKMYLQSFAPVIASGQGGDRPIDGSLGDAVITASSGLPGMSVPGNQGSIAVVPVDTVPVLQMQFGADPSTITQTFTSPIPACPTYPGGTGVSLGGGRTGRYKLKQIQINPPLPAAVKPPAVWRPNHPSNDTSQTLVDLALFSRNPNVTNSALERSTELTNTLISIWGDACNPIAPAACVFWAFCGQPLGPSPTGWILQGIPTPDPPGTVRTSPVPVQMIVEQPTFSPADTLLANLGLQLIGKGLQPAQVIGTSSTPGTVPAIGCIRGVELPELLTAKFTTKLPDEIKSPTGEDVLKKLETTLLSSRWLRFDTGLSNRIRMLMGIELELKKASEVAANKNFIVIRERDLQGVLISERPLNDFNPLKVNAVADLPPATWKSPTSPWFSPVSQVFSLLQSLKVVIVFIDFKPTEKTASIEVAVNAPNPKIPSLIVGVVESCPASETSRVENATQIQASTIQTIQSYLDGGTPVPLLAKDTIYTVTATYDVTVTESSGSSSNFNNIVQAFQFKTDNKPPAKLDPWVLCTAPEINDQHAFYEDPVNIVLNDSSIIQLFTAYGFKIEMDLRAADGLPEPSDAPVTTVSVNGVGTAAYDALLELVKSGKLPCVGIAIQYQNQIFTAPVTLRPLMGYTLDLNTNPSQNPPPDPNTAIVPLFRRTFATSKYPTMKSLADDLGATRVTHRALKQKLTLSGIPGKNVLPDQDLQDAFLAAGEQALPAPDENAIVVYWAQAIPGGPFVPHAILIDCTEPLWRTRSEPSFQNPIPEDPTFKIVTISGVTSLELVEQGSAAIGSWFVSPAGTRSVGIFKAGFAPPPGGSPVNLALHRPASATFALAEESDLIVSLPIEPLAPWENDHV